MTAPHIVVYGSAEAITAGAPISNRQARLSTWLAGEEYFDDRIYVVFLIEPGV